MRIFTLMEAYPDSDKRSCLNGKLMVIKVRKGSEMLLFDITSKDRKCLWITSTVEDIKEYPEVGLLNVWTSNHTYKFINVETLLPSNYVPSTSNPVPIEDLVMVSSTKNYKSIHYGDGYDQMTYEFNRDITREEFVKWCTENTDRRMNESPSYPFENYVEISGTGNVWRHKIILCYTD